MANGGYDFYLDKCLLPISPAKLQVNINNANETVTLINEGEINILRKAKLTDIEFECDIPQIKYPYAVYPDGFKGADYFLGYFEKLKNSQKPFQFIVSRKLSGGKSLFYTNMKVSLEDYKVTEDAKEGFDLKVKIELKQYREYGTKMVKLASSGNSIIANENTVRDTSSSPEPASAQTYTVVEGDSLYAIAKRFYGDGSKYIVIYNANKELIGSNPNLIYQGQVLLIPDAGTAENSAIVNSAMTKSSVGTYKGSGGTMDNPPFTILAGNYGVVRANIVTWNEAWGYYNMNGGKNKGWKIVDADSCIIST